MTEYILFVIQQANFCSRVLFVPKQEFIETRNEEFLDLLETAKSAKVDGVDVNLLIQNVIWEGTTGRYEQHPWSKIIGAVTSVAEWGSEGNFRPKIDDHWADESFTKHYDSFNHVKTYQKCLQVSKHNNKDIKIVDSFLVLESRNGKLEKCVYDTPDEMMLDLYS